MKPVDLPLVSVIMSVYNGAKFIQFAIDSILNQTFHNFEFIIINDGSTDSTSEILNTYVDHRLVIIERENKGLSASLNEAILNAKGQYIARMDADDIALPNRLELQFDYMEANPNVGILGGQAFIIDEVGRSIGEALKPVGFNKIQQYMKYACPVMHPTYFVKRKVYDLTKGYRLLPIEDYDFLLRAFEMGVVIENLPEFLVKYRTITEGLTLSNPQRTIALTRAIQKMHLKRVDDDIGSEKDLVAFALAYDRKLSWWFKKVNIVHSSAKKYLLYYRKNDNKVGALLMSFAIVFISLFHYQIFMSSYAIYKASKLV